MSLLLLLGLSPMLIGPFSFGSTFEPKLWPNFRPNQVSSQLGQMARSGPFPQRHDPTDKSGPLAYMVSFFLGVPVTLRTCSARPCLQLAPDKRSTPSTPNAHAATHVLQLQTFIPMHSTTTMLGPRDQQSVLAHCLLQQLHASCQSHCMDQPTSPAWYLSSMCQPSRFFCTNRRQLQFTY